MKKKTLFMAASALMLAMGSCTNDVLDGIPQVDGSLPQTRAAGTGNWTYAYVLSEGTWHVAPPSSPGSIVRYDNAWKELSVLEIGDTGNDLIQYGSKLYCAVSGHDLTADNGGIWVLNAATGQLLTSQMVQYDDDKTGHKAMPRHLAATDGKVYISLYSGAVMSIDTTNYVKEQYAQLDATYSEGICIGKDNKVYICNSGNTGDTQAGEGTTISVLPLTLASETQITVPKNPKLIAAYSADKMYFNVLGDGGMHSALYKFNPTTPDVDPTQVTTQAGGFAIGSEYLYTADIDWSSTAYETVMQMVQLSNDKNISTFAKDEGYQFGFSVTVNPFNGDVCFGQSMGDALYVYDSAGGDYKDMVNTGTANVNTVVFVK